MSALGLKTRVPLPAADDLAAALAAGKGEVVRVECAETGRQIATVGVPLTAFAKPAPQAFPEKPVAPGLALLEELEGSRYKLHKDAAVALRAERKRLTEAKRYDRQAIPASESDVALAALDEADGDLAARAADYIRRLREQVDFIAAERAKAGKNVWGMRKPA